MKRNKKTRHSPRFVRIAREAILHLSERGYWWGIQNFHDRVGDFIYQFCELLDEGLCVNLDDKDDWLTDQVKVKNPFSQYILTQNLNLFEQVMFKEHFGVKIDILENKR